MFRRLFILLTAASVVLLVLLVVTDRSAWYRDVLRWLAAAVSVAMYPVVTRFRLEWDRQRRREAGLCPACGYDLRATPNRCPECGARPGGRSDARLTE